MELYTGWNLVGYNYQKDMGYAYALASIEYMAVYTYDNINKVWLYSVGVIDNVDTLRPGGGLWIKVLNDCVWTLSQ
ncbi:MAG: hypothetical protein GF411_20715 [Candidatus Lokiarchaeota archaeon]|nr:hypothetical protein [Candidatus Lokiarchaeota archaeon]